MSVEGSQLYGTGHFELPPITIPTAPDAGQRFIQTHELWRGGPAREIQYDTTQLTDSLVCISMSNEIRKSIDNIRQGPSDFPLVTKRRNPVRLTGTTKLFGESLFSFGGTGLRKPLSQPAMSQMRYRPHHYCHTAPTKPLERTSPLDLRLSPVNFTKLKGDEGLGDSEFLVKDSNEMVSPRRPKKSKEFRLPYRECLLKSKSPTIDILEVECLMCGQHGSIYRHRAEKSNCGRCGSSLAIKLDKGVEYKFKVTNKISSSEIKEKLRRHGVKLGKNF